MEKSTKLDYRDKMESIESNQGLIPEGKRNSFGMQSNSLINAKETSKRPKLSSDTASSGVRECFSYVKLTASTIFICGMMVGLSYLRHYVNIITSAHQHVDTSISSVLHTSCICNYVSDWMGLLSWIVQGILCRAGNFLKSFLSFDVTSFSVPTTFQFLNTTSAGIKGISERTRSYL